jgi:ATP-dependent 26S proteasome regulatory subunit
MNAQAATQDWRTSYDLGLLYLDDEDYAAARRAFDDAITGGADRWEPFYARAWSALGGQFPTDLDDDDDDLDLEAIEADLQRALDLGGTSCADAAAILGCLRGLRDEHGEAFQLLLFAVGRSQHTVWAEEAMVRSLTACLDQLERQRPADADSEIERLLGYLRAANLPRSVQDGLTAEILIARAFCREREGRSTEADEDLRAAAQLTPGHPRLPERAHSPVVQSNASTSQSREPTFAEVGGQEVEGTFQYRLSQLFETYFAEPDVERLRARFSEYGQIPTRTVLMFGPSGCGKTYVVRAFSGEYRRRHGRELTIHRFRLNEVMERYVGETEKAITRIFNDAVRTQPSVIFADEVDAIAMSRESAQDYRIAQVAHLLTEIDRFRSEGAFVVFFGCTNRVWSIDMALLRRFDQLIPVELPGEQVREKILGVHLGKLSSKVRAESFDLAKIAKATHGLTAGDIEKVVRRAVDDALRSRTGEARSLTEADVLRSLSEYRQPMHVREWMRQSVQALRGAGHNEMAEEVERLYGPYVNRTAEPPRSSATWTGISEDAWSEEPQHNHGLLRSMRR